MLYFDNLVLTLKIMDKQKPASKDSFFTLNGQPKVAWHISALLFVIELVRIVIISLAIIIPVRYFLIQPFYVKGASMEPNFYDNEYLVIDEISYRFKEPTRGEAVVFKYPKDPKQYFIKRIVGLPGEKVEIKNGAVYIDGIKLDESEYLDLTVKTTKSGIWLLRSDEYLVLGDNRYYSLDSRDFGPIDATLIVGRAWVRGWPLHKITLFEAPDYNGSVTDFNQ